MAKSIVKKIKIIRFWRIRQMEKRLHIDSRTSENFTEKGLEQLTGQSRWKWLTYIVKELIDNSLEAIEAPEITVSLTADNVDESDENISVFSVRDNGNGVSEENIYKIFENIDVFSSTKRHYKNISRGSQGNALKTVLGIQQLLNMDLVVRSNESEYTITIKEDVLSGGMIAVVAKSGIENINGFEVIMRGGLQCFGRVSVIYSAIINFVELNPQASFKVIIKNSDGIEDYKFESDKMKNCIIQKLDMGKATTGKVNWFSYNDFMERVKADLRIDPDMNTRAFVGEFLGLTSDKKQTAVMKTLGKSKKLNELIKDSLLDADMLNTLYNAMKEHTDSFNAKNLKNTLGSIGEENLKHSLIESLCFTKNISTVNNILDELKAKGIDRSVEDLTVYYSAGDIYNSSDKEIPFYFELIAIPMNYIKKVEDSPRCNLTFGINQSFVYSTPKISLNIEKKGRSRHYNSIEAVFQSLNYDFKVICNLFCPTIEFQDKGKQIFNDVPFRKIIQSVVNKAHNKLKDTVVTDLNKLNDKDDEDSYNDFYLEGKAPKGFLKRFVFENFQEVYNDATDNGNHIITQRQLYYAMRPLFLNTIREDGYIYTADSREGNIKKLDFKYKTFEGYVDEYEREILGKRLVYKEDRGFAVEPHSNKRIDLGTATVNKYEPDLNEYNNILFIEKAGFYEQLHNDFELTKKYDLLLVNSKGFGTNAVKDLIEKIQRMKPSVKLYTLTDFDIRGLGIDRSIKTPDELSVMDIEEFNCDRIGITLDDVRKYKLQEEPAGYSRPVLTELENRFTKGEIDQETYNFFKKDLRVEINALKPREFKEYLINKFAELGIKKVEPELYEVDVFEGDDLDEFRQETINEVIGEFVKEKSNEKIYKYLDDLIEEVEEISCDSSQNDIHSQILGELNNFPAENWKKINTRIVDQLKKEYEKIKDEAEETIKTKVWNLLEKNIVIRVDFINDQVAG